MSKTLYKIILNKLFPPLCVWCEQEWVIFCKQCTKEIIAYSGSTHQYTQSWYIDTLYIWFSYTGPIRNAIRYIKYNWSTNYVPFLLKKLAQSLSNEQINLKNTIVTSVPMHWWKKHMIRWFNQGELLGKELAKIFSISYKTIARKKKWTLSQTKLSRIKRKINTLWVFTITESIKHIDHIIIVDDLITTWATLQSLSKEIKLLYPNITITCIAVARN